MTTKYLPCEQSLQYTSRYISQPVIPKYLLLPGDLRWQKPLPADPWNDTFDALSNGELGLACMQVLTNSRKFYNISEDCLTLNVYIPDTTGELLTC